MSLTSPISMHIHSNPACMFITIKSSSCPISLALLISTENKWSDMLGSNMPNPSTCPICLSRNSPQYLSGLDKISSMIMAGLLHRDDHDIGVIEEGLDYTWLRVKAYWCGRKNNGDDMEKMKVIMTWGWNGGVGGKNHNDVRHRNDSDYHRRMKMMAVCMWSGEHLWFSNVAVTDMQNIIWKFGYTMVKSVKVRELIEYWL